MAKKRLTDHANRPGHLRAREAKQRSLAEKELARQMTASRLGSSGSTAASDPAEDRTTSLGHQSHCSHENPPPTANLSDISADPMVGM